MSAVLIQENNCTEDDYYNLPENIRAELIDGQIYYQAAPSRRHQKILNFLNTEINIYIRSKDGSCEVYPSPFAVKLSEQEENIVEPDISVICDPRKLTDSGCTGAPDWIIEIVSPGTSSHDYVRKLKLYLDAGVREYWIVDPSKESILVYWMETPGFEISTYTFSDNIKVNLYRDLSICLDKLNL